MPINFNTWWASAGAPKRERAGMIESKPNLSLEQMIEVFGQDPGFDHESFNNLYEDTGEETVIRIMAHFNENLKEAITHIQAALPIENNESVWKWAHKIAGSAALLGFKKYGDESRALSKRLRDAENLREYHRQVEDYLRKTIELNRNIERAMPSLQAYL